ncbi:MAG: hypothetical protein U0797_28060 [Gemmataceae bacterium]
MRLILSPRWHPRVPLLAAACLVLVALLVLPTPVFASESSSPVFAGWFSKTITKAFEGLATRSRVIQVCVVTMCLALFILMKKFADVGPRR